MAHKYASIININANYNVSEYLKEKARITLNLCKLSELNITIIPFHIFFHCKLSKTSF